jgi:hypothetical protein
MNPQSFGGLVAFTGLTGPGFESDDGFRCPTRIMRNLHAGEEDHAIFEQAMRYSKAVSRSFVWMISIMLHRFARLLKVSREISDSKS